LKTYNFESLPSVAYIPIRQQVTIYMQTGDCDTIYSRADLWYTEIVLSQAHTAQAGLTTTMRLRCDCNATALRLLDNLRYDRRPTCVCVWQWCGLRPSVLGQDRSETGLRTRPVWDRKNRSWSWSCTLWSRSWSWSCRSGVVLWKLSRSSTWWPWTTQQLFL